VKTILFCVSLTGAVFGAEWELDTYDGGLINGTFRTEAHFATISVSGDFAVPGKEIISQIFMEPGAKDKSTIRSFTLLGVQAGSLLIQVETQENEKHENGDKKCITLYYELQHEEAAIPIFGGAAPAMTLFVKRLTNSSTFKVRLAPYTLPKE